MPIHRLSPDFAVSPQIRPQDAAAIAAAGFRAIVNNRPDGEEPGQPTAAEIEQAAREAGLAYAFLPVGPGQDVAAHAVSLRAFLAEHGPVLAFCKAGVRSAWLWEQAGGGR